MSRREAERTVVSHRVRGVSLSKLTRSMSTCIRFSPLEDAYTQLVDHISDIVMERLLMRADFNIGECLIQDAKLHTQ